MTFDKDAKIIRWEKSSLFNNWCWGNWIFTLSEIKLPPPPALQHTPKLTQSGGNPNTRAQSVKLLEENTGEIPHDIGFSNESVDVTPKHRQREKNGWISSKLRSFVHQRIPSREWKGSQTNGEENLQILCLQSRIYRELLQLNDKKNKAIQKWARNLKRSFPKKVCG